MRQWNVLRSTEGYTLLEVLVAAALTGLVFLMASGGMVMFSRGSVTLNRSTMRQVDLTHLSTQFSGLMETAKVAVEFQHTPIRRYSACPGPENMPAVRRRDGSTFTCVDNADPNVTAAPALPAQIEFFRDQNASFVDVQSSIRPARPLIPAVSATLRTQPSVTYSAAILDGNYYVTWPMIDETSPPFTVLRTLNSDISLQMVFCDEYIQNPETCNDVPTNPPNAEFVRFKSPRALTADDEAELRGSLLLIYNSKNAQHFVIVAVKSISSPGDPKSRDLELVPLHSGFPPLFTPTGGGNGTSLYFADYNGLGYPNVGAIPTWSTPWSTQTAGFYLFPTHRPSAEFEDPAMAAFLDTLPLRRVAYYYSIHYPTAEADSRPRWIAIPLQLTKLILEKNQNFPPGCPVACPDPVGMSVPIGCPVCDTDDGRLSYRLRARNFSWNTTTSAEDGNWITLADHLHKNNVYQPAITFARKLGSAAFEIYTPE